MNPAISRLYVLVIVLFALLVAFTSRWTVFEAQALKNHPSNARQLLAEKRINRGEIYAGDEMVARSRKEPDGTFTRRYPEGPKYGHPVGYSHTLNGRAGLERSLNDILIGDRVRVTSLFDTLMGEQPVGDDIRTTLNPKLQQAALSALGANRGAIVVLDVDTGAVLAMASTPTYNPNDLVDDDRLAALNKAEGSPLINRATQYAYPPGSTMKVVTAAAALDSGRYTPSSQVNGKSGKKVSGVPLNNFGDTDYGNVTLTTALEKSINTVWAEVGEKLGGDTMTEYMERFGFYEIPPLDYPEDQMVASGVRGKNGKLLRPDSGRVDIGRMVIGQGQLQATALQMASVVQTVGNGGVRMQPRLVERVIDDDGRTVEEIEPEKARRVISEQTAEQLTAMMRNAVENGTGKAADVPDLSVAGKTGTAETNASDLNQPWFIGFTDEVAVAVTIESQQGGLGGEIAAPIAKRMFEETR